MVAFCIAVAIVLIIALCYANSSSVIHNVVSPTGKTKGGVNNPGFLRISKAGWVGATMPNNCYEFECFDTLANGVRAWYINLYGKVKSGLIKNTNDMIDVLTPASDPGNSELARNNYKNSVARANNWLELGMLTFNFEACPEWVNCNNKQSVLNAGLQSAYAYLKKKYNLISVPPYTLKP